MRRGAGLANRNHKKEPSDASSSTSLSQPFDEGAASSSIATSISQQTTDVDLRRVHAGAVHQQRNYPQQQLLQQQSRGSLQPTRLSFAQQQLAGGVHPPPIPAGAGPPSLSPTSIQQQQQHRTILPDQQQQHPGISQQHASQGQQPPGVTSVASVGSTNRNTPKATSMAVPPPPAPPPVIRQQQQVRHAPMMHHQPHGASAIGPSSSSVSSSMPFNNNNSNMNTTYYNQQQYLHHQQQQIPNQQMISVESPLPTTIQRGLGDRSNEKRKNAALEIESFIKQEVNNFPMIASIIAVLSKDFCTSMNSNYRKGGLVGLAATAIGLLGNATSYLNVLLPPVLHCFDDPDSRVRYYACESLYNIAKVSRQSILQYFNPIFEGLAKLFADVDVDVKNGANLLDRLIKDIVTEAGDEGEFHVDQFLPLLQNYIRRTNPYIRQLIVGWITLLDSIPDISMLDYLPDFLDGLFNMLSDSNREIRQAADSALSDFLRELSVSNVLEFGPIISILVYQCKSKERLNRLTAITWLAELSHHPRSGGDALLPYHADILGAIMCCISDNEKEIRLVAERTNDDLLQLVKDTKGNFELRPLLDTLTTELLNKDDVPTKMATLRWINMLMEKRKNDMNVFTEDLLPVLLKTLSDPSDAVILLDLQVLSRISLSKRIIVPKKDDSIIEEPFDHGEDNKKSSDGKTDDITDDKKRKSSDDSGDSKVSDNDGDEPKEELQFQLVLTAILKLFAQDRKLLETRGSLIIRKLCVLLNAKSVYIRMADTLSSYEIADNANNTTRTSAKTNQEHQHPASTISADYQYSSLQFISTMVQTLNLILLTASELHDLRSSLARSFDSNDSKTEASDVNARSTTTELFVDSGIDNDCTVFATLFHCWCHNPVATFSLCLLARAYDLSFALVQKFSDMEDISVGFLMQIDKLVHLLESPIFVHLRLQLLNVEAPYHAPLLKSIYGVLMCLPQGDAYRLLNDRLATVCNLRDNLGVNQGFGSSSFGAVYGARGSYEDEIDTIVNRKGLDMSKLLERFDYVMEQHREAKYRAVEQQTSNNTLISEPQNTTTSNGNHVESISSKQYSIQQQASTEIFHSNSINPNTGNYGIQQSSSTSSSRPSIMQQQHQQINPNAGISNINGGGNSGPSSDNVITSEERPETVASQALSGAGQQNMHGVTASETSTEANTLVPRIGKDTVLHQD